MIPTPTLWTPPWYATIPDLLGVFAVSFFAKNMMMMYQPIPQIRYVSQVSDILVRWSVNSVLSLVIRALSVSVYVCMCVPLCCFALFSMTKLTAVHNLYPPSRSSLPPGPVQNQYVMQGMQGCRSESVAEDESLSGSC